jgi:isopenicillin N synthase-like dioxygenase
MSGERLNHIPVVDLADFQSKDRSLRQETTETTVKGLHDIGFLFVKTPQIAEKLPRIYPVFRKLFTLPEDTLLVYERKDIHHQRGYTPSYAEIGIFCQKSGEGGAPEPDSKKNWFIGPEHDDIGDKGLINRFPELYAQNIWPEEVPELKEASMELYHDLFAVGKKVLNALEKPLGYEDGFFEDVVKDSPTSLRPLYYPPVEGGVGACDHTDINYVTVLPAPTREGLWVKTREGKWIKGMAPEGCSLVQVGDMLQYTTGGEFHSAIHKVDPAKGEGRYSTALFGHARSTVDLKPADQWEADPQKYPSLTAGAFLYRRLEEIGLAKKEARGGN